LGPLLHTPSPCQVLQLSTLWRVPGLYYQTMKVTVQGPDSGPPLIHTYILSDHVHIQWLQCMEGWEIQALHYKHVSTLSFGIHFVVYFPSIFFFSMAFPAHSGPRPFIQFRNHFSQTVGLLGRVISSSQGRYLNARQHNTE
jgi:hypothetical protein